MTFKPHPVVLSASLLGLFAVIGTTMVAYVNEHTKDRIAANERAQLLRSLHEIMPQSLYDNDILNHRIPAADRRRSGR